MTITQVLYVLAVAKHGNVSKAAEEMFVSQPALSMQLRKLEEELGCQLFHRLPQGVAPTAAGTAFCADAAPVAKAWRRLQESVKSLRGEVCAHVRIGLGPRVFSNDLFDPIVEFFDCHPDTGVSFISDMRENFLAAIDERRMDLAVSRLPPASMLRRPERFTVYELFNEEQCVLLAPDDPRREQGTFSFAELDGCAIVSGPVGSADDIAMKKIIAENNITPSRVHRADDINSVMTLVRSGRGLALGPRSFAAHYGAAALPLRPQLLIPLNLICLKEDRSNPTVIGLLTFLQELVKKRQGSAKTE